MITVQARSDDGKTYTVDCTECGPISVGTAEETQSTAVNHLRFKHSVAGPIAAYPPK